MHGAVVIGVCDAGVIFGLPILVIIVLRHVKNEKTATRVVRFLGCAFIEAFGFWVFALNLLDMYNNSVVAYLVLSGGIVKEPLTSTLLSSLTRPVYPIVFVLSFSIRTIRYLKMKRLQKKASK